MRTDRIGDVVLATPLVRALRRTFPEAHLAALVRPYTQDLLRGNPHLDEVLLDDAAGVHSGRRGFWRLVGEVRRRRFDTALLLLPTKRLAYALFCAGIPRRIGVGRKPYEVLTFMQSVSRHKYVPLRHEADYCLDLGRKIGVRIDASPDALATEVFLHDDERAAAGARLGLGDARSSDAIVGIHPSSGGSSPNWPAARYVELAARLLALQQRDLRVVVTGEERAPDYPRSPRLVDRRGKHSLRELMADVSQLGVLVSASTGPMHIAAALGVPTVSLFCPLPACAPALWGPQGNAFQVILPPPGCCPGRCPRDPKRCRFEEIEVGEVVASVLGMVPARGQ